MTSVAEARREPTDSTFEGLYAAHVDSVWRVARLLGVAEAHLDDVVHDVFLIAHRRREDVDPQRSARAWLHGIARNVVKHYRRAHARAQRRLEVVRAPQQPPSPDEAVARKEAADFMDRFLASLLPEQAEAFILFEIEQMTGKEIAAATRTSINTVFSRIRSARRRFDEAAATFEEDGHG